MRVSEAMSRDVSEISQRARLLAMFAGWLIAFYGAGRRDVRGSITAMAGLGLAMGALVFTENEHRGDEVVALMKFMTRDSAIDANKV
jgi:hypothetical protein